MVQVSLSVVFSKSKGGAPVVAPTNTEPALYRSKRRIFIFRRLMVANER
jgi:hypothetical protein